MNTYLNILMVEDSEDDALLIIEDLSRGCIIANCERVQTEQAMSEALDRQAWDIIIADYSLPHFSGMKALELAQRKDPDIPLILISGVLREEDAVEALRAGARDFVSKDNLSRLCSAVQREVTEAEGRRERRRAEEERRISDERYRLLYETMLQGVVYHDAEGRVISMNPSAERILGKSPEEFLGQTTLSMEHDTIREDGSPFPGAEHPVMVALQTGKEITSLVMGVYNHRENGYRWISASAVPLFHPGEHVPYQVYAIFSDITEMRQSEERERQRESEKTEFYRQLILSATEGKLVVTERTEIEKIAGPAIDRWEIHTPEDTNTIRHILVHMAEEKGLDKQRVGQFAMSIGEALTNAVKHAGIGEASLHETHSGLLILISDHGPGIPALSLPAVALTRGYSTVGTLGMGYKIMIGFSDMVYLATGPDGTTVGIEVYANSSSKTAAGNR
jgi:PAS domain S-box-containing protein